MENDQYMNVHDTGVISGNNSLIAFVSTSGIVAYTDPNRLKVDHDFFTKVILTPIVSPAEASYGWTAKRFLHSCWCENRYLSHILDS